MPTRIRTANEISDDAHGAEWFIEFAGCTTFMLPDTPQIPNLRTIDFQLADHAGQAKQRSSRRWVRLSAPT